jgi:SAM-dependent methyltransferase
MEEKIAQQLIALNRQFYQTFGREFSSTRGRVQPGVRKILAMIKRDESILDLGCGNGNFARALNDQSHLGRYLGLDFSAPLLADAITPLPDQFAFQEIDLTGKWKVESDSPLSTFHFSIITSFAALHHIPSHHLRLNLINQAKTLLAPNGLFIHSNWQFLNSDKLRKRIQPWSRIGLTDADVDAHDYLLDWRSGGEGLRYVHAFSEDELALLAQASGFVIVDQFYFDGENGRLGLYQVWKLKENIVSRQST